MQPGKHLFCMFNHCVSFGLEAYPHESGGLSPGLAPC